MQGNQRDRPLAFLPHVLRPSRINHRADGRRPLARTRRHQAPLEEAGSLLSATEGRRDRALAEEREEDSRTVGNTDWVHESLCDRLSKVEQGSVTV